MKIKIMSPRVDFSYGESESGVVNAAQCALVSRGKTGICSYLDALSKLENLMKRKPPHESVLGHATVSMIVTCSRACSLQLVRHRHAEYMQESTRYCRYDSDEPVEVIVMDERVNRELIEHAFDAYEAACQRGIPHEHARYLLPHCLSTRVHVTASLRWMRNVVRIRSDKSASPEFRAIAARMNEILASISPVFAVEVNNG